MSLTIGSLFSGIGGLELGLERAGLGPVLWQCEINPFARRVLAKHWPDATRYEDVRGIDEATPRVDVICGGFPCQDISLAGKRAGIEDGERSGLWSEYARIVRTLRPRFVIVENVAGLLGFGFGRVLGDLAACGYDTQWDCIPASALGACHVRDRVFVVAHDCGERGARFVQPSIPRVASLSWREDERGLAYFGDGPAIHTPKLCRASDGVPDWLDRLHAIGNAVVPQVAEVVGRVVWAMAESTQ